MVGDIGLIGVKAAFHFKEYFTEEELKEITFIKVTL